MTWIVQPMQRKNAEDQPNGLWHLCAKSDEGGGFHNGCEHDHASAEEAQDCHEAKVHLGQITGFPHNPVSTASDYPLVANRNLNAAAPDLLTACIEAESETPDDSERQGLGTYVFMTWEGIDALRAAISKALAA